MTTLTLDRPPLRRRDAPLIIIAGLLAASLFTMVFISPWLSAALLAVGLALIARPMDPFGAVLLAVSGASFVGFGEHHLARDHAALTLLAVYGMACFAASHVARRWGFPLSSLSMALTALAVTTGIAVIHGVIARNTLKYVGLELFPLLGLGLSLALGGLRLDGSHLRAASRVLVAVALANAAIGFIVFALTKSRTGGTAFSPLPGLAVLVVLNLSLYGSEQRARLSSVVVIGVLTLHQILTFTRGYWLGLIAGAIFSCLLYGRGGAGARLRWAKVGRTFALLFLATAAGLAIAVLRFGWSDISAMLGSRFASSFETRITPESASNIVRLIELRTCMRLITAAPWTGYGHGFELLVRQSIAPIVRPQAWIHQTYVMIWLKQGIFGLLALLWVLYAAVRMGVRGSSHTDRGFAGWCAASAACTVAAAVIGLTNYTFFLVNQTFFLATLWGLALAAQDPVRIGLAWRNQRATVPPGASLT